MIQYRIPIATNFPVGHINQGEPTNFFELIEKGIKLHTIRGNYDLWKQRFEKINYGDACLVLYRWLGKAYNSKTEVLKVLTVDDGIGLQELTFLKDFKCQYIKTGEYDSVYCHNNKLAQNDGLTLPQFNSWFKKVDDGEIMALIHFTKFRY